jgi:hypothetical protein
MKCRFMVYGEFSEISKDGILGHINIWIAGNESCKCDQCIPKRINIIWFVFHKYLIHFVYDKDTTVVRRILITIREFWNLQMLPKSWIFFGWFSHGFLFVTLKTQSYINILLVHLDTWKCATWGHM